MIEQVDLSRLTPTVEADPSFASNELLNIEELNIDDLFSEAHTGAADDLLLQFEASMGSEVRSDEDQKVRDEIAAKALSLVISAAEGTYTEEGRRFELVEQLVARIGALCNHDHLSEALQKHLPEKVHAGHAHEDDSDEDDDHEVSSSKRRQTSWLGVARPAGLQAIKPLFAGLQKLLSRIE